MLHIHGHLLSALCEACGGRESFAGAMLDGTWCAGCGATDRLRPDIVFFGEIPYEMERIEYALQAADLFVSIGTSGAVYPAAGFVRLAKAVGAETLELNLEPSEGSFQFGERRFGPASVLVPEWVEELLSQK